MSDFWKQFRSPAEKALDELVENHEAHLFYLDDCPHCREEKESEDGRRGNHD